MKPALRILNGLLAEDPVPGEQYAAWREDVRSKAEQFPMGYPKRNDVIVPQWAIQVGTPPLLGAEKHHQNLVALACLQKTRFLKPEIQRERVHASNLLV